MLVLWRAKRQHLCYCLKRCLAGLGQAIKLKARVSRHMALAYPSCVTSLYTTLEDSELVHAAVPRAAALGWHVFETRQGYAVFMALTLAVYTFCIFSTMVRRQIKNISKPTLAKVSIPQCR